MNERDNLPTQNKRIHMRFMTHEQCPEEDLQDRPFLCDKSLSMTDGEMACSSDKIGRSKIFAEPFLPFFLPFLSFPVCEPAGIYLFRVVQGYRRDGWSDGRFARKMSNGRSSTP